MSLWYKPIKDLTFEDVDEFLGTGQTENVRLDYKVDTPKDLAKPISAFANTLGGMIILGIDEDKATGTPIWPPRTGMPEQRGIEEQIIQVARDAIYPPVRVSISQVIPNAKLPGHVIVVIRVDQSRDAPHAIEKRRKVYVYERTEKVSTPYALADIDRIENLLMRRRKFDEQRASMTDQARDRAERRLNHRGGIPTRWISIMPAYPWQQLWEPKFCFKVLKERCHVDWTQRIPNGAATWFRGTIEEGLPEETIGFQSILANGHIFALEYMLEVDRNYKLYQSHYNKPPQHHVLEITPIQRFFNGILEEAQKLYHHPERTELPGMLWMQIGLIGIHNHKTKLLGGRALGKPFVDLEFIDEEFVAADEFLVNRMYLGGIFGRMRYALDVPYEPDDLFGSPEES